MEEQEGTLHCFIFIPFVKQTKKKEKKPHNN